MKKEKILADIQSRIWFLHDERKFEELSRNGKKLFLTLGFPMKESSLAGKFMSDAYFFYDKAGEEDKKGNNEGREYYFKKVLEEQKKIRRLMGEDVRAAYYENKWWIRFYYRDYVGQLPYMFLQQVVKYKGYNILILLKALFYLIEAGLKGHNKRKIGVAAKYLEKYWKITLKHMKDKIQY